MVVERQHQDRRQLRMSAIQLSKPAVMFFVVLAGRAAEEVVFGEVSVFAAGGRPRAGRRAASTIPELVMSGPADAGRGTVRLRSLGERRQLSEIPASNEGRQSAPHGDLVLIALHPG